MGPLSGVKIVEFAGIGPGPFCGMMLADMGAEVIRLDRTASADLGVAMDAKFDLLSRGRPSVALNLKSPEGIATAKRLISQADALIEGFRPGVMERLGLGPDECLKLNPKLVFGRMTGWGQQGPMAPAAGHDVNYISLTGALDAIGRKDGPPVPPLNLVGDFGGGAMYLAFGVVCALLEAKTSGQGQVVDAAMVDGAASLMTSIYGLRAAGIWSDKRGDNILDTGAPWYDTYQTADGAYISFAAIEAKFFQDFLQRVGLEEFSKVQNDRAHWPAMQERFTQLFKGKTRDEWRALLEGTDVCFAPVLSMDEAPHHPHLKARGTFVEVEGIVQPGPAPRFSRTPGEVRSGPSFPGQHTDQGLKAWGFSADEVAGLRQKGAVS